MEIREVRYHEKDAWNQFIGKHYPPVGAFMQTWEWGLFQEALGRKVERFFLSDGDKLLSAFTMVHYLLPYGLHYGYVPRGPVIASDCLEESEIFGIFNFINSWARKNFPKLAFLRLEPPIFRVSEKINGKNFYLPSYYIQPRFNTAVFLDRNEEEILAEFHSSTRSNIRRAEKRCVSVETKNNFTEEDLKEFFEMISETVARNGGKNAYPSEKYFRFLIDSIPVIKENNPDNLSLGVYFGRQNGQTISAHFVVFFGGTATYLFGASRSGALSSKVTTHLHWTAMREAKKRGFKFYDLGGVDDVLWPTLTKFKRQFGGREFQYMGNIDIPLRPIIHRFYNIFRVFRKIS